MTLVRRASAEALGTALLLVAIVGSGVMASRSSPGDAGLALFESAAATAAALAAIILTFGPISGAHVNPVVTLGDQILRGRRDREGAAYVLAQVAGAIAGTVLANLMLELPAIEWGRTDRSGMALWLAEAVATFGLVTVVFGSVQLGRVAVAVAVGAYVGGAYFFTSSTGFANPAVTIGRMFTDSFAGIAPAHVLAFIAAQAVGALAAVATLRFLIGGQHGGEDSLAVTSAVGEGSPKVI